MVPLLAEMAMAPRSNTFAWKIPWMEEPGGLQSMGSLRVRHGWATSLSLFTFMHWRRKSSPLQCSCLENPRDGGAWWAATYGVAQSRTRLKRLSSSSSNRYWALTVGLMFFFFSLPFFFSVIPWVWGFDNFCWISSQSLSVSFLNIISFSPP